MRGQPSPHRRPDPGRRRVVGGMAVLAAASPGHAATSTAAQAAAAKAKYIEASGYTGKEVHATWAGPSVGVIAWTVGSDFVATKTNAYRSCRTNWTGVDVDVSWNSSVAAQRGQAGHPGVGEAVQRQVAWHRGPGGV